MRFHQRFHGLLPCRHQNTAVHAAEDLSPAWGQGI